MIELAMTLRPIVITRMMVISPKRDITRQWIMTSAIPGVIMGMAFQACPLLDLPLLRQRDFVLEKTPDAFLDFEALDRLIVSACGAQALALAILSDLVGRLDASGRTEVGHGSVTIKNISLRGRCVSTIHHSHLLIIVHREMRHSKVIKEQTKKEKVGRDPSSLGSIIKLIRTNKQGMTCFLCEIWREGGRSSANNKIRNSLPVQKNEI
jgi:hypothetical protein